MPEARPCLLKQRVAANGNILVGTPAGRGGAVRGGPGGCCDESES